MRTRNRLTSFASILPGLLTVAGSLVISGFPKRGMASANSGETSVIVKDWTAAGSGCRAQKSKAGDVELKSVRAGSTNGSELVVLRFALPKYKLTSPPENPSTSITFARECALRVVALPKGKVRIKSVAARTPVTYSKDADVGLKMQYLLRLDGEIVGQSLKELDAGQQIRNAEETVLLSGKPSDEAQKMIKMAPQNCGTAQMLGFDYTFIAARKNRTDAALVQIADEKQLEIAVEMEPCG